MACSVQKQIFPNLVERLRLILLKLAITSETALQLFKKLCPCFQLCQHMSADKNLNSEMV